MNEKYLGESIIPSLKAKFDDKVNKSTYDAELEKTLDFLRSTTKTNGWHVDLVKRNIAGTLYVLPVVGVDLGGKSLPIPSDPTSSYGNGYTHLARLCAATNGTRSSVQVDPHYRRIAKDGETKIDTEWVTMDPSQLVLVEDGTWIETQVGVQNVSSVAQIMRIGEFWTPGLVPSLLDHPILYTYSLPDGKYVPLNMPVYENVIQSMGTYQTNANFYYRNRYQINSKQCTNSSGLLTVWGIVEQTQVDTTLANNEAYGMNLRIV